MQQKSLAAANIMIVDDNPVNIELLEEVLRRQGHEVCSFPEGMTALSAATKDPPDLILLDINMPHMSGFDVCTQLKATPKLSRIPVIFLSAVNETKEKEKAFRSGAVDYISKPFHLEEVIVRVETHLKLHILQLALERQNERLEETVAARTQELAKANERLTTLDQTKSDFLNLISHEFRTPLNGLFGVSELILKKMSSSVEHNVLREIFKQSRRRVLSILDDALLLTHIDVSGVTLDSAPVSLTVVLNRALDHTSEFARSRRVILQPLPPGLGFVVGKEDLLVRAFHALLETAVKFSEEGGSVRIMFEVLVDSPTVTIEAHGRRVPGPAVARFFEIFSVGEAITPGGDLGLGPPVAYRVLSLFGAAASVANIDDPAGIRLTVSFAVAGTEPQRSSASTSIH